jgi:hypothetical protein
MSEGTPRRIVFCVSGKGDLVAGNADLSHVYSRLITPELGGCSQASPPPLHECVNQAAFQARMNATILDWSSHDQFIFYFSGHGEVKNDVYCLKFGPAEGDWWPFESILLQLKACNVMRAIFMIDACYSAHVMKGDRLSTVREALPKGMALLASSGEMQTSQELKSGAASVFTRLLCGSGANSRDEQKRFPFAAVETSSPKHRVPDRRCSLALNAQTSQSELSLPDAVQ